MRIVGLYFAFITVPYWTVYGCTPWRCLFTSFVYSAYLSLILWQGVFKFGPDHYVLYTYIVPMCKSINKENGKHIFLIWHIIKNVLRIIERRGIYRAASSYKISLINWFTFLGYLLSKRISVPI